MWGERPLSVRRLYNLTTHLSEDAHAWRVGTEESSAPLPGGPGPRRQSSTAEIAAAFAGHIKTTTKE